MKNTNITEYVKKIYLNKNFVYVFIVSLISLIIILIIGLGLVWYFRANVFDYFAKEYLQEVQNPNTNLVNDVKLTA